MNDRNCCDDSLSDINETDLSIYKMILNENYFDELKLTDDIESSDGITISHNNKYATPEDWFMDMRSNIREKLFTDDNTLLNKRLRCV
jgi:hypothetical protein